MIIADDPDEEMELLDKAVSGYVDENGEVCIINALKGTRLEFEGKDM